MKETHRDAPVFPQRPDSRIEKTRRLLQRIGIGLFTVLMLTVVILFCQKLKRDLQPAGSETLRKRETASSTQLTTAGPETDATQTEPADSETETATPAESSEAVEAPAAPPRFPALEAQLRQLRAVLLYPTGQRFPDEKVSLLALGDNLMHSTVVSCGLQPDGSYDFREMYRYIREEVRHTDLACINQETIFIDDPAQYSNYPIFGGPTAVGEALADTGFDVITHATNHCYDKFFTGISDTLRFWRNYPQVTTLGIHDSAEDAARIRVVEVKGIRVALLNYTYGTNMGTPAEPYMIDFLDRDKVEADLKQARELADLVLVFPHWGTEGSFVPDDFQREWARFLVDHGADAIIGGHPHTLQPLELFEGPLGNQVPVFWSTGNFISHMRQPENQLGGMARLTLCRDRFGCYVADPELIPTMTYGTEDFGQWQFYGMPLEDYTDEMAAHHWVPNTSVEEMWDLYHRIVDED